MSKTALELPREEWQHYHLAETLRRRQQENRVQTAQRKQRAWNVARQAAEVLRQDFGAAKVVVFGSLAHGAWFTPWSDIDLAAWGIPAERFYAAVGFVAEFDSEFRIDLVDPDEVSARLRAQIAQEGHEL